MIPFPHIEYYLLLVTYILLKINKMHYFCFIIILNTIIFFYLLYNWPCTVVAYLREGYGGYIPLPSWHLKTKARMKNDWKALVIMLKNVRHITPMDQLWIRHCCTDCMYDRRDKSIEITKINSLFVPKYQKCIGVTLK